MKSSCNTFVGTEFPTQSIILLSLPENTLLISCSDKTLVIAASHLITYIANCERITIQSGGYIIFTNLSGGLIVCRTGTRRKVSIV